MMDFGTQSFGLLPWCEVVFSPLYKCTSLVEPFLSVVIPSVQLEICILPSAFVALSLPRENSFRMLKNRTGPLTTTTA